MQFDQLASEVEQVRWKVRAEVRQLCSGVNQLRSNHDRLYSDYDTFRNVVSVLGLEGMGDGWAGRIEEAERA